MIKIKTCVALSLTFLFACVAEEQRKDQQTTDITIDIPQPLTTFSSLNYPIKSNQSANHANRGPQNVFKGQEANYPGLRLGDFLLKNNPWNYHNSLFEDWYQSISLEQSNNQIVAWLTGTMAARPIYKASTRSLHFPSSSTV